MRSNFFEFDYSHRNDSVSHYHYHIFKKKKENKITFQTNQSMNKIVREEANLGKRINIEDFKFKPKWISFEQTHVSLAVVSIRSRANTRVSRV